MEFINTTHFAKYTDDRIVTELLEGILSGDGTESIVIYEEDKGMIVGVITPFLYGPYLVATELGWYVHPDHRKTELGSNLLGAFEYWAKEKGGASMVVMGSLNDKLDNFYEKKGYTLNERAYMKVL